MKVQVLSHLHLDVAPPKPISIEDTNRNSACDGSFVVQVVKASSC